MGQSSSYAAQNNSNKMGSKSFYPVALLLLFCLIHASSPLQCFVCDLYDDAYCGDPFYHEDDYEYKRPKDPSLLKHCPPDIDWPFCKKMDQYNSGDERVIRSCGSVGNEREHDCYTTVLEGYNTKVCEFYDDGCNSGNMFQVSTLAIVSAILMAFLKQ